MRRRPVLLLVASGLALLAARAGTEGAPDLLSTEMDRWTSFVRTSAAADELGKQVRGAGEPLLERARAAVASGRRLLATQLLLTARAPLAAAAYAQAPPASAAKDAAAFEAEWRRMGDVLGERLARPAAGALDGVRPAALRALGEAALPQSRVFYDASLEYGRATMPEYGLFYLGSARAAGETVDLCRSLSEATGATLPPVRSVRREIDALEGDLLDAYRPPLSVDRHPDFIAASSQLKEARELDDAGLLHGALVPYLQAAQRFAPLRGTPPSDPDAVDGQVRELAARLSADGRDHTIGRLFLERAQEALAASPPETAAAQAIASDVLPRYLAALDPARAEPPRAQPNSRSRSSVGPIPETSRTRQVCWPTPSHGRRAVTSWSRTTASRRSRSGSASRATRSSS